MTIEASDRSHQLAEGVERLLRVIDALTQERDALRSVKALLGVERVALCELRDDLRARLAVPVAASRAAGTDPIREREPRGCPTPGACSCPKMTDNLQRLSAAATPGPWGVDHRNILGGGKLVAETRFDAHGLNSPPLVVSQDNAQLIAAAVNYVRSLPAVRGEDGSAVKSRAGR